MTTTIPGAPVQNAAPHPRPAAEPVLQTPARAPQNDVLTEVAAAAALPFTLARQLLPDTPVPVVLGTGALLIAGVIEWPAAVAVTAGYLALRRWHRPLPPAA